MTDTFDPDLLRERYRAERDKRLRADANEQYIEGRPADRTVRNGSYGAGSPAFIRLLEQWREAGDLAGLELER
jgi:hypothetical protein